MTGQSPLLSCLPLDAKRQVESWVHNVQSHLKENTHSFRRLTERATAHFRHLGSYSRSILTRGTHAVRGAVEVLARMHHRVITSPCLPHSSLTHCFELRVCHFLLSFRVYFSYMTRPPPRAPSSHERRLVGRWRTTPAVVLSVVSRPSTK